MNPQDNYIEIYKASSIYVFQFFILVQFFSEKFVAHEQV